MVVQAADAGRDAGGGDAPVEMLREGWLLQHVPGDTYLNWRFVRLGKDGMLHIFVSDKPNARCKQELLLSAARSEGRRTIKCSGIDEDEAVRSITTGFNADSEGNAQEWLASLREAVPEAASAPVMRLRGESKEQKSRVSLSATAEDTSGINSKDKARRLEHRKDDMWRDESMLNLLADKEGPPKVRGSSYQHSAKLSLDKPKPPSTPALMAGAPSTDVEPAARRGAVRLPVSAQASLAKELSAQPKVGLLQRFGAPLVKMHTDSTVGAPSPASGPSADHGSESKRPWLKGLSGPRVLRTEGAPAPSRPEGAAMAALPESSAPKGGAAGAEGSQPRGQDTTSSRRRSSRQSLVALFKPARRQGLLPGGSANGAGQGNGASEGSDNSRVKRLTSLFGSGPADLLHRLSLERRGSQTGERRKTGEKRGSKSGLLGLPENGSPLSPRSVHSLKRRDSSWTVASFSQRRSSVGSEAREKTPGEMIVVGHANIFAGASDAPKIVAAFKELVKAAQEETGLSIDLDSERDLLGTLSDAILPILPHRMRNLFSSLDRRLDLPSYESVEACRKVTVVVLGSGPIGLRCAIEMALLGCSVHLLESRNRYTRLNVLHLWDWVEADLIELGVKTLDPSVFAAADFKHVATCQMQHSLLKVALLLGVHVHFDTPVRDLQGLQAHGFYAAGEGAGATGVKAEYNVLVDATGSRCALFDELGFEQVTVLKSNQALGLVCHMQNGRTRMETTLHESNWAHQFHTEKFKQLSEQGVSLQNIVYYRSTGAFSEWATHYFVMTAQADSMLQMGALIAPAPPEAPETLCARSNLDLTKLEVYARVAVRNFVPELADLDMVPNQLQLFDFSERKQSNKASVLVPAAGLAGSPKEGSDARPRSKKVLITRVGDALQEPFWPEGLGINRGFLHVLDCADLVQGYARVLQREAAGASKDSVTGAVNSMLARREALFNVTKKVSGHNRNTELKPPTSKRQELMYRIDPRTRYVNLPANLPLAPAEK